MTLVKKHNILAYLVIANNIAQHSAGLGRYNHYNIIYCKPENIVHRIETVLFYFCVNYYNFVGFLFISCENKINYVKMNCSICSSLLERKEPEKNNIYSFSAYCYIIIYNRRIFFSWWRMFDFE